MAPETETEIFRNIGDPVPQGSRLPGIWEARFNHALNDTQFRIRWLDKMHRWIVFRITDDGLWAEVCVVRNEDGSYRDLDWRLVEWAQAHDVYRIPGGAKELARRVLEANIANRKKHDEELAYVARDASRPGAQILAGFVRDIPEKIKGEEPPKP